MIYKEHLSIIWCYFLLLQNHHEICLPCFGNLSLTSDNNDEIKQIFVGVISKMKRQRISHLHLYIIGSASYWFNGLKRHNSFIPIFIRGYELTSVFLFVSNLMYSLFPWFYFSKDKNLTSLEKNIKEIKDTTDSAREIQENEIKKLMENTWDRHIVVQLK